MTEETPLTRQATQVCATREELALIDEALQCSSIVPKKRTHFFRQAAAFYAHKILKEANKHERA